MRQKGTILQSFKIARPRFEIEQAESLRWLGNAHAQVEALRNPDHPPSHEVDPDLYVRLFQRYGCRSDRIGRRGTELADALERDLYQMEIFSPATLPDRKPDSPRGLAGIGLSARTRFFEIVSRHRVRELFPATEEVWRGEPADHPSGTPTAPPHLIHVTCTGYVSPSAAQSLINERHWNRQTQVTHAYHMGCYASLPAVRIANGLRAAGLDRIELVHTEICSLHLDLSDHSPEQMVVQSLFADGYIRYAAVSPKLARSPGLELLALHEEILPDTLDFMTWRTSEWGMRITLSKDVPKQLSASIRGFLERMLRATGCGDSLLASDSLWAIHPGGPRIIDQLQEELTLKEEQIRHSKATLYHYGNMSSATLPHIWASIVEDENVPAGRWVISLAFGPGLTAFGALMRKH